MADLIGQSLAFAVFVYCALTLGFIHQKDLKSIYGIKIKLFLGILASSAILTILIMILAKMTGISVDIASLLIVVLCFFIGKNIRTRLIIRKLSKSKVNELSSAKTPFN
jgi:hypothetical protein